MIKKLKTKVSKAYNALLKKEETKSISYSQQGEDLVIEFLLANNDYNNIFYIDLGANHPIKLSNTHKLSSKGAKGICIEPNVDYNKLYKKTRPEDLVLNIGITAGESTSIPYYKMAWPEFNTFDKEQAEAVQKKYNGRNDIIEVLQLPVVNINEFLKKYHTQTIDILNIDIEGLDLEILEAWNFKLYPPKIICVEIKDLKTGEKDDKIITLLESNGYEMVSYNLINAIFLKK